jgi:SAM-dependent methyltransferase
MKHSNILAENEVRHGRYLAAHDPESVWGWSTPAGKLRAARRAELIINGAKIKPGQDVLEIGCGTGNFTKKFAFSGATILACDISPELIEVAKEKNHGQNRVRFACLPLENLPIQSPFDAVIGSSILHHLKLRHALEKIYKLLKPGGRLCFAEPNMLNPQILVERKFRGFFPSNSPDETAFIRFKLHSVLRSIGFNEVETKPFDWLHPSTPENLIPLVKKISFNLEKIPLVREFSGSLLITATKPKRSLNPPSKLFNAICLVLC